MDNTDYRLSEALEDWCETKTVEVYGEAGLSDFGSCLVLPSGILNRIVSSAHNFKIKTVGDLYRETKWIESRKYGEEILELIRTMGPQWKAPESPKQDPMTTISNAAIRTHLLEVQWNSSTPNKRKCSHCGGGGSERS